MCVGQFAAFIRHDGPSPWLQFNLPEAFDIYSTASWAGSLWVPSVTERMNTAMCCRLSSVKNITRGAAWSPQTRRMI